MAGETEALIVPEDLTSFVGVGQGRPQWNVRRFETLGDFIYLSSNGRICRLFGRAKQEWVRRNRCGNPIKMGLWDDQDKPLEGRGTAGRP